VLDRFHATPNVTDRQTDRQNCYINLYINTRDKNLRYAIANRNAGDNE